MAAMLHGPRVLVDPMTGGYMPQHNAAAVVALLPALAALAIDVATDPAVSESVYSAIGFCPYVTLLLGGLFLYRNCRGDFSRLLLPSGTIPMILMAIFGARPLLYNIDDNFVFHGWVTVEGARGACQAGLLFLICFIAGYAVWAPRDASSTPSCITKSQRSLYLERYAIGRVAPAVLLLLLMWYVLYVLWTGRPDIITVLLAGRSASTSKLLAGAPALFALLPVCAAVMLCFARILYERAARFTLTQEVVWWVFIVFAALPAIGQGTRRFQIPVLVAAGYTLLCRQRFPGQNAAAFSLAGLGFVVMATIPFVRSAGSRRDGESVVDALQRYINEEGVNGVFDQFFLSYDTEMFDYVSWMTLNVDVTMEYGLGRSTVLDFLLNPLPAAVMPGESWSNSLLISMTGLDCATGPCPVSSVVGVSYADFGMLSVLLVGLALGGAASWTEGLVNGNDLAVLGFITATAFATVVARGSAATVASLAVQCWFVVLVFWFFMLRPSHKEKQGSSASSR